MKKFVYLTNTLLSNPSYWHKVNGEYQFRCPRNMVTENLISQGFKKVTAWSLLHGYEADGYILVTEYPISEETKRKIEMPHKAVWNWCEKHCEEFLFSKLPPEFPYIYDAIEMEEAFASYVRTISLKHELQYYLNQVNAWLNANAVDWDSLEQYPEQYRTQYIHFMNNKRNECNCEHCPHRNDGFENRYPYHPCGQPTCWVTVHCSHDEDEFYGESEE